MVRHVCGGHHALWRQHLWLHEVQVRAQQPFRRVPLARDVHSFHSKEAKEKLKQGYDVVNLVSGNNSGPLGFLGSNIGGAALTSMLGNFMGKNNNQQDQANNV